MSIFMSKKSLLFVLMISFLMMQLNIGFAAESIGENKKETFFTVEQEKYLADNPSVYAYFSKLYVPQKTPADIAKEHKLTEAVSRKYLEALANIKLIEPFKGDLQQHPHFLVKGVSSFSAGGPLSEKFSELLLKGYYEKARIGLAKGEFKNNNFMTSSVYWLTQKEYDEFKKELLALDEKYLNLSVANRKSNNKDAFRVSSLLSTIPNWEQSFFTEIKPDF